MLLHRYSEERELGYPIQRSPSIPNSNNAKLLLSRSSIQMDRFSKFQRSQEDLFKLLKDESSHMTQHSANGGRSGGYKNLNGRRLSSLTVSTIYRYDSTGVSTSPSSVSPNNSGSNSSQYSSLEDASSSGGVLDGDMKFRDPQSRDLTNDPLFYADSELPLSHTLSSLHNPLSSLPVEIGSTPPVVFDDHTSSMEDHTSFSSTVVGTNSTDLSFPSANSASCGHTSLSPLLNGDNLYGNGHGLYGNGCYGDCQHINDGDCHSDDGDCHGDDEDSHGDDGDCNGDDDNYHSDDTGGLDPHIFADQSNLFSDASEDHAYQDSCMNESDVDTSMSSYASCERDHTSLTPPQSILTREEIEGKYMYIDQVMEKYREDIAIMMNRGKILTQKMPQLTPEESTNEIRVSLI